MGDILAERCLKSLIEVSFVGFAAWRSGCGLRIGFRDQGLGGFGRKGLGLSCWDFGVVQGLADYALL